MSSTTIMHSLTHVCWIVGNYLSIIGNWCQFPHTTLNWHHMITIYFEVCTIFWMVNLSQTTTTLNCSWFSFCLIRTRSSIIAKSSSWQKMAKSNVTILKICNWLKFIPYLNISVFSIQQNGNYFIECQIFIIFII